MISLLQQPFLRFPPEVYLILRLFSRGTRPAQGIDLEAMPENLQRDIGIMDGRERRGHRNDGAAFLAARHVFLQRSP